jgi:catechol 2,3-dioxygenase-like lactoylglutathione lyase family enzyme
MSEIAWLQQLRCTHVAGIICTQRFSGGSQNGRNTVSYVIKFVTDLNKAVKFYRDTLGLQLRFESRGWSEFATGETTLALHPASDRNPAGKVEFGFTVADVEHERARRALQHSANEAGFRRVAGPVRRFRRCTLQRDRKGGIERTDQG